MKQPKEKRFLDLFREIDGRLAKETPARKIPLYIFGGAAAVIAYGSRRGTLDIDTYIEDSAIKRELLNWAGQGSELERGTGFIYIARTRS